MNIGESGNIFIERAHPAYEYVIDFLVSCCEPVSRTSHMEQYRMDSSSLSAATAEGTYTLGMIEIILRHFRLNKAQELPVDLTRCTALQQLATALDESAAADQDDTDAATTATSLAKPHDGPSASAPSSSAFGVASRMPPLPACLHGVDFSHTALAPFYPGKRADSGENRTRPSITYPAASSAPPLDLKLKEERAEGSGGAASRPLVPSSGRVLQLFRPTPPPPSSSSPTAAPPAASSPPPRSAPRPTRRALISLAVVRPSDVEDPLPEAIATMLFEEENASRVQIVLQPRLRRFHSFDAGQARSASASAAASSSRNSDEELFYFIESRQRAHLELVLDALKTYLEPVLLYGKERWILSDVDRSPASVWKGVNSGGAERAARDAGRPAVLRMLYEPLRTENAVASAPGAASSSLSSTHLAASSPAPASRFLYKCQVRDGKLREVKACLFSRFNIRADCYYDYLQDRTLHVENLNLASNVRLRPYQVASLERFRRANKAHQGVVVLPCGAGKTLTGIGAAASMKKTTIVMCVNNMSVFQWQREFLRWTDLTEEEVTVCTSKVKQKPGKVFITTYSMVIAKRGHTSGAAAEESRAILRAMTSQPWGLLLLDEVHTALAHHFQDVLNTIKYKCVLGLSATLLREDDKIGDLRHLVGPKLYEANWLDLTRGGFLANVECAEVQCPMPLQFLKAYRDVQRARLVLGAAAKSGTGKRRRRATVSELGHTHDNGDSDAEDETEGERRSRRRGSQAANMVLISRALHLASCNPYKLWCTQALLAFHQQRSPPDKVIIFCDYLADVRFFAHHLHLPYMNQRTSEAERTNLLRYFQYSSEVNAIILTRVGDVALDLPCASVIIQVSGLGASRRQEAQRLGRILRPKPPSLDNTCAYFYTLVSQDTGEIRTSYKRQSWLRDQGFAYRILHSDRVLEEFVRVGGKLCCIGPPRWWYQASSARDAPAKAAAADAVTVLYEGVHWAPFSEEAALKIEKAFRLGKGTCLLKGSELGAGTLRPSAADVGHYPLRSSESWEVTFSSADAPQTFGTVRIGEGNGDVSLRVRRVRRGCLDRSHRCAAPSQHDDCLTYALHTVAGAHDAGSESYGAGALLANGNGDEDAYDDYDDDDDLPVEDA